MSKGTLGTQDQLRPWSSGIDGFKGLRGPGGKPESQRRRVGVGKGSTVYTISMANSLWAMGLFPSQIQNPTLQLAARTAVGATMAAGIGASRRQRLTRTMAIGVAFSTSGARLLQHLRDALPSVAPRDIPGIGSTPMPTGSFTGGSPVSWMSQEPWRTISWPWGDLINGRFGLPWPFY